jgi:hypothetical protein
MIKCQTAPGLPDGVFAFPKSKVGSILGPCNGKNVGILYGRLVHFTVI